MINITIYNRHFYLTQESLSRRSAREIIPLVLEIVQPQSVIDVGCGVGGWSSVFLELGVREILGIDGDWVDTRMLQIPKTCFASHDLTQPLQLNRKFDLVVSLEVAEHLPSKCAEVFVDSLVRLGPIVLFSAAIPLQGGTHHINEQWPEYWSKLFEEREYVAVDAIRKRLWQNNEVDVCYAQNILFFVNQNYLKTHAFLKKAFERTCTNQLSLVHPKIYLAKSDPKNFSLRQMLQSFPIVFEKSLERAFRNLSRKFKQTK